MRVFTTDAVVNTHFLSSRLGGNNGYAPRGCCRALVEELCANQVNGNCWTCNDSGTAGELIAMGVDFITTNILE